MDSGPPYFVKLINLPLTCNDAFVEDLFASRFMPFVKFRIVYDQHTNPLDSGVVKKVAFVELRLFDDQSRVVKWHDCYYLANRRVITEVANFDDFSHCMKFNQEHLAELHRLEHDFLAARLRPGFEPALRRPPVRAHGLGVLLDPSHSFSPLSAPQTHAAHPPHGVPAPLHPSSIAHSPASNPPKPRPKPNPFGSAKPVDVVAKEKELDDKIVAVNRTTMRTLGGPPEPRLEHPKPGFAPAPLPPSVYGKQSLADMLSSKDESELPRKSSKSASSTPKLQPAKPVILRKKHSHVASPQSQSAQLEKLSPEKSSPEAEAAEAPAEAESKPEKPEEKPEKPAEPTVKPDSEKEKSTSLEKLGSPEKPSKPGSPDKTRRGSKPGERRKSRDSRRSSRGGDKPRDFIRRGSKDTEPVDEKELARIQREQHHLAERNKFFATLDRPNFKKHFVEMTEKKRDGSSPEKSRRLPEKRDRKLPEKRRSPKLEREKLEKSKSESDSDKEKPEKPETEKLEKLVDPEKEKEKVEKPESEKAQPENGRDGRRGRGRGRGRYRGRRGAPREAAAT